MASIFKVAVTRKLPKNAEVVTRQGERCFRTKRSGRTVLFPLTPCGTKYREESRKWYIQYRDANGERQRVPGYTDKDATLQFAAELERKAEHIQSGLSDPHEKGKLLPLKDHLKEFRADLLAKANSTKHVEQTCNRIERALEGCEFERWIDIVASKLVTWLGDEREAGRMAIKTSNYYLAAVKQFCTWLEDDGKVPKGKNPVEHLSALNADTDVRWERRGIGPDEFARLVAAAEAGPEVQRMSGADRAMLYVVAAWTGYRREELASLTLKSFDFTGKPATAKVKASYSKRRRNDVVPLHAAVVERLKAWIATKGDIDRDQPLFDLRAPAGGLRRTAKMMRLDLERARKAWIEEAKEPKEGERREKSDYLQYCNEEGMYADFHANRHTFITNLAHAGVHPKMAQSVARHSDINLTMGIYSHVEVAKQADAINALPAPPKFSVPATAVNEMPGATIPGTPMEHADSASEFVAPIVAPAFGFECLCLASAAAGEAVEGNASPNDKPLPEQGLVNVCRWLASDDASSGGGTRTPDTRIMIPPVKTHLPLKIRHFCKLPTCVCTKVCTSYWRPNPRVFSVCTRLRPHSFSSKSNQTLDSEFTISIVSRGASHRKPVRHETRCSSESPEHRIPQTLFATCSVAQGIAAFGAGLSL